MGELALRKILAGVETTPGVAVTATRKVYGTFEPKRDQPRRWAMEERGVLVSNFRANAKLVDASWNLKADVLFEDFPFWLNIMNKGGVTPTGGAGTGYHYDYTPAIDPATLASNPLGTYTIEWGDEVLAWQFPYSQGDSLKVELGTDNPITFEMGGFSAESWPQGRNGFTGFSTDPGEHAVEAPNGWQIRLFIDKFDPFDMSHNPIGLTHISTRYVKATAEYKNQNKRKYFGDFAPFYQKIGRGRREVTLALTLEEDVPGGTYNSSTLFQIGDMLDTNLPNFRVPQARVRLQAVGSQIAGTTFGVVNAMSKSRVNLANLAGAKTAVGGPYTTAAIDAATFEAPTGASILIERTPTTLFDTIVLSAPLHVGDVSVSFNSFTPTTDWPDEANLYILPPYQWLSTSTGVTADVPGGAGLIIGDGGQVVTAKASSEGDGDIADVGDKTIPITDFTPRNDIAASANIFRAKSIEFDFYGALEGDIKWAAHETNVAYDLSLVGVYDTDAGKQEAIYVTNGNPTITS
jgi:hypothetical protein